MNGGLFCTIVWRTSECHQECRKIAHLVSGRGGSTIQPVYSPYLQPLLIKGQKHEQKVGMNGIRFCIGLVQQQDATQSGPVNLFSDLVWSGLIYNLLVDGENSNRKYERGLFCTVLDSGPS